MKITAVIILLTALTALTHAQDRYILDQEKSLIRVIGTSSVHDWEMEAKGMKAGMMIRFDGKQISHIPEVSFVLDAKQLTSGNSIMDKKSWNALKAGEYKNIAFNLKAVHDLSGDRTALTGRASGELFIAGEKKEVTILFKGNSEQDGRLTITGSEEISMHDFNIDPPTAMMGALKTGADVKVEFKLTFAPENEYTELLEN